MAKSFAHYGMSWLPFLLGTSVVLFAGAANKTPPRRSGEAQVEPTSSDQRDPRDFPNDLRPGEPDFVIVDGYADNGSGFGGRVGPPVETKVLTRTGRAKLGKKLQEKYPYVSLKPRLAKLKRPAILPPLSKIDVTEYDDSYSYQVNAQAKGKPRLRAAPPEKRLLSRADHIRNIAFNIDLKGKRASALRIVHSTYFHHFVDTPGVGWGRGIKPGFGGLPESFIELDDEAIQSEKDFSAAKVPPAASESPSIEQFPSKWIPPVADFKTIISQHQNNFASIPSYGYGFAWDVDQVAGFRPHEFLGGSTFELSENYEQKRSQNNPAWKVARLELVSLLMHDRPAVYVSKSLPRMSQLFKRPVTRALDEFETTSLTKLEEGENVVFRASPNKIEMLGAVRAVSQCRKCHEVERGALLGAFSYTLHRDPQLDVAAMQRPPRVVSSPAERLNLSINPQEAASKFKNAGR